MTEQNSKIRVKVGDNELELEGPPELINQQYKDFLNAVARANVGPKEPAEQKVERHGAGGGTGAAKSAAGNQVDPPSPPPPLDVNLKRVFAEKGAVISLLALPKTDKGAVMIPDALLLLAYGYYKYRTDDYPVSGVRLMQAAKQSGIPIERVDRSIDAHARYILSAGFKRGKKYSLNNQGIAKAEEILKALLE